MEKVYRLLPWLGSGDAANYARKLTGTDITSSELLLLSEAGECPAYLECTGRKGKTITETINSEIEEPVTGFGHSRVVSFRSLALPGPIRVYGEVEGFMSGFVECEWWLDRGGADFALQFKRADIEALAAKMNGEGEQPSDSAAEVEALRQQLEQERARKQPDLDRYADLASKLAITTRELEQEHAAREAAEQRADRAEAEAEALRQELAELSAERDEAKQQADEPSPKSRNAYLRTIAALGYALIDGSTGQPHPDADAILAALAAKAITAPLQSGSLASYLKQAAGV
jgi:hypothetical protein